MRPVFRPYVSRNYPKTWGKNGTSIFAIFGEINSHWLKPLTYSWKPVTIVLILRPVYYYYVQSKQRIIERFVKFVPFLPRLSINDEIHQANKGVSLFRKLQIILPRNSLLTICKLFIRPLLDYADVIYDQPSKTSFSKKIESVQYNAVLAITGAIKGSSCEKLYQELGMEYIYQRRWARKFCLLCKVFQLVSDPTFMIYYHQWEVLFDMLIRLIWYLAHLNISRTLPFLMSLRNEIN